jgi:exodeoxyribonuclease VIII
MKIKVESNEAYHSTKRHLSSSAVKTIAARSVYHLLNSVPYKETEDMMLGTAVHARFLEPESYFNDYLVMEPLNRTYKAGKEKYAEYQKTGKLLLKAEHGEIIEGLENSVSNSELAQKYLDGDVELSHYSEYMGVKVKVRPDVKNKDFLSDIKTCQDASPRAFRRDVYKYNWHIQAAFYSDVLGYTMDQFKFIAMQKKFPYDVIVYTLDEQMQEEGYDAMVKAVADWKKYLDTGEVTTYNWPTAKDGTYLL